MRFTWAMLAAVALFPIGGCSNDKDGTSISINAGDNDASANVDGKSGQLALNMPGFHGTISLPKVHLGSNNFEVDGVHLYPGSSIRTMNVDSHDDDTTGKDADGTVHIMFDSPADPATVRDWFRDKMQSAHFKVADDGNGLSGTTADGKPFKIEVTPADKGKAHGTFTISG
ncbi:MAG: hypothetical protein ACRCSO_00610 [Sphingomonas sp.]